MPAENVPTLGLLAGTIKLYAAQKAPVGLPMAGHGVLELTVMVELEFAKRGTVKVRLAPETVTVCSALRVASMLAPVVPLIAVTMP